jgi:hypothetical protein
MVQMITKTIVSKMSKKPEDGVASIVSGVNNAKSTKKPIKILAKTPIKTPVKVEPKPKISKPIQIETKKSEKPLIIKPIILSPAKTLVKEPVKEKVIFEQKVERVVAKKPVKQSAEKPKPRMKSPDSRVLELPPEHEAYFVYLKNPLEYRRCLLEASKKMLLCLRTHQKLLFIRQRKIEEIANLRTSIKELLYLNKKFNEKLPKYDLEFFGDATEVDKITPRGALIPKMPVIDIPKRMPEPKREKTELERLEESLANIESKLRNLQ